MLKLSIYNVKKVFVNLVKYNTHQKHTMTSCIFFYHFKKLETSIFSRFNSLNPGEQISLTPQTSLNGRKLVKLSPSFHFVKRTRVTPVFEG